MQVQASSGTGVDITFVDYSTSSVAEVPFETTSAPDALIAMLTRGPRVKVNAVRPSVFWVGRVAGVAPVSSSCDTPVSPDVQALLARAGWLVPVLNAACAELKRRFGVTARLALEVLQDPEDDWSEQLFVVVRTSLDVDTAMRLREEFLRDWWLGRASASARRAIGISVDVG